MAKQYISFSDREYYISHMKAPRGTGVWLFQIGSDEDMNKWFSAYGTLAQAKKLAAVEAKKRYPNAAYIGIVILP